MKKEILNPKALADRLHCFGHYDPHDAICLKWCQLNIRCAIAREHYEQLEILEDFFVTVTETTRVQ